jgi:hypothetical protein
MLSAPCSHPSAGEYYSPPLGGESGVIEKPEDFPGHFDEINRNNPIRIVSGIYKNRHLRARATDPSPATRAGRVFFDCRWSLPYNLQNISKKRSNRKKPVDTARVFGNNSIQPWQLDDKAGGSHENRKIHA